MLVSSDPDWTRQVQETWAFMEKHYVIIANEMCSTHVHISMQRGIQTGTELVIGMGLPNMKKLAQCIIHWEIAVEALVPEDRRRNMFATSNWIDNINFQEERITRRVAIDKIEHCATERELIKLMSPLPQERFFAWNFRAIEKHGTIEFRKGGASVNASEALAWGEFVLLFVQAALRASPEAMRKVPANTTELKKFLGPDNLKYLKPIFSRTDGEDSRHPVPLMYQTIERAFMLQKKLIADEEEQQRLRRDWKS